MRALVFAFAVCCGLLAGSGLYDLLHPQAEQKPADLVALWIVPCGEQHTHTFVFIKPHGRTERVSVQGDAVPEPLRERLADARRETVYLPCQEKLL